MARKVPNGPAGIPEEAKRKVLDSMARKVVNEGKVCGTNILLFLKKRNGERFNVRANADQGIALATARSLVLKGCTPG
jgi:hypothetical protein